MTSGKKKSVEIRSFLYLDQDKMASISSQVFQGFTDQVIKSETQSREEHDQQSGKIG